MSKVIEAPQGVSEVVRIDQMTDTQRTSFLKTGEVPTNAPTKETQSDAAAQEERSTQSVESGAAPDAADESQQQQEQPTRKSRYQRTIDRKTAEIKALAAENERLRNARPNEQAKPSTTTAEIDPNEPRLDDYIDAQEWARAFKKHLIESGVKPAIADVLRQEREIQQQAQTQTEQQKQIDKQSDAFAKRAKEFRKTLPVDSFSEDFSEVNGFINESQAFHLADALVESEVGPALMHYFNSSDAAFAELESIAAMSPTGALMALGRLAVSDKIKVPASPTVTRSRKIGDSKVNGTGSTVSDDTAVDDAVQKRDMGAFMKAEDKREGRQSRRGAW